MTVWQIAGQLKSPLLLMIVMMLVIMVLVIMKLTILFQQVKEMEAREPSDDMLDTIVTMFEHEGRSRRQVGNKLRELGLISSMKDITRKPLNARNMPWTEEEVDKVRKLYKDDNDGGDDDNDDDGVNDVNDIR